MGKEIKPGTLTELLIKQALPMMQDKLITSVELIVSDGMVTLIYRLIGGAILRDTWKLNEIIGETN